MGRKALPPEERERRVKQRKAKYWEANKDAINARRRAKYAQKKREQAEAERAYQAQAEAFIEDIEADTDLQEVLRAILEGADPREVLTERAKRQGDAEE